MGNLCSKSERMVTYSPTFMWRNFGRLRTNLLNPEALANGVITLRRDEALGARQSWPSLKRAQRQELAGPVSAALVGVE